MWRQENERKKFYLTLEWSQSKIPKEKCKMKKQNLISIWRKRKQKYQGGSRWDELHCLADGRKDAIVIHGGDHESPNETKITHRLEYI